MWVPGSAVVLWLIHSLGTYSTVVDSDIVGDNPKQLGEGGQIHSEYSYSSGCQVE